MKIYVLKDYELINIDLKSKYYTHNQYIISKTKCNKIKDTFLEDISYKSEIEKTEEYLCDRSVKVKKRYIGCIDKDSMIIMRKKYIIQCEKGIKHVTLIESVIDSDETIIKKYFKCDNNMYKMIKKYIKYIEKDI